MPDKFDRCVQKVKAKGKVRSPYAVCKKTVKGGGKRGKR